MTRVIIAFPIFTNAPKTSWFIDTKSGFEVGKTQNQAQSQVNLIYIDLFQCPTLQISTPHPTHFNAPPYTFQRPILHISEADALVFVVKETWKFVLGNHRLRTTSLTPRSKLFPQNFTVVETFNRFLAVCVMRYLPPQFQEAQHSSLHRTLPVSYTAHFRALLSTNRIRKRTLSFKFSHKTLVCISKFPNAPLQCPGVVNSHGRFQVVKTQVLMDIKPSDTASHRLASYQTPSWMLSTLSSWCPLRKFLSLMSGSTKIYWDFFMFVSLIQGNFCCNGHILYVCVADPWKLLL